MQGQKPAGTASTGRHQRPGWRGSAPAPGGSRLRLRVPATSGGEAGAGATPTPGRAPRPRPGRLGAPPASRGPGPQTQARKASVHLPAPRSGCRRRRRAAHPRCQVSHPAHGPARAHPRHDPKPVRGGTATPATRVRVAHAPPGFEHLCPRKLISFKARPKLRLSLNANTRVTWPELRLPHLQRYAFSGLAGPRWRGGLPSEKG